MRKEFFLVILISLMVCKSPTNVKHDIILRFEGTVTDVRNGNLIAGASVNYLHLPWGEGCTVLDRAITDQSGHYSLEINEGTVCTDGASTLGVTADGYREIDCLDFSRGTYSVLCTDEVQIANFQLEPL